VTPIRVNLMEGCNMLEHDEIDLRNLRDLTPEQWALLKKQVNRRAQAERAKVIRELFALLWRSPAYPRHANRSCVGS
jgi:hypothetical protein